MTAASETASSAAATGKTSTVGVDVEAAACRAARLGSDSGDDARSPAAGAAVSSDASAVTNPAPSPARCHAKPPRYARSARSETPHPYQSGFVDPDAVAAADSDPPRSRSNRPVVPVRPDCEFRARVREDPPAVVDCVEPVDRDEDDEEADPEVRERLVRFDRDELAVEDEDDARPELDRREDDDRDDEEVDRDEDDEDEDDVVDEDDRPDDRLEVDRSPAFDPPEPPSSPAFPGYLNFVRPSRRFSTYVP